MPGSVHPQGNCPDRKGRDGISDFGKMGLETRAADDKDTEEKDAIIKQTAATD